ncbi:hypothetical protein, partial [Acetobacter pomorum]|uniref:hypothetical protein n=1 Tax=Acetobacter pomorum TaxID=65959 RepID=UPI00222FF067
MALQIEISFRIGSPLPVKEDRVCKPSSPPPDPGVAALYAGPKGVVYRFDADQTAMRSGCATQTILDGRWHPDSTAHNCPISDDQYLLIESKHPHHPHRV